MAPSSPSSKKFSKSLGSLLRYMEGIEIIVELKTGKRYRGVLNSADDYMNLTLDNVEQETPSPTDMNSRQDYASNIEGTPSAGKDTLDDIFSSLNIRGSTIRYVHFPDNADLTAMVRTGAEREKAAAKKYSRGKR